MVSTKHREDRFSLFLGLPFQSASSLKFAVKAARKSFYDSMRKHLQELEKMYVDELMATKDANEGINSFIERRKPQWVNE